MKRILVLSSLALLTACATTPKQTVAPLTPEQRKIYTEQFLASHYTTRFNDSVTTPIGTVQVIGRDKIPNSSTPTEPHLMIVKRSDTTKVNSLEFISSIVLGSSKSYSKNDLKGHLLEPQLDNHTLELARPQLSAWTKKSAALLSVNTRPLQTVSLEPERFYLVYERYMGGDAYQFVNGMTFTIQNTWEPEKSYIYKCEKTSSARPLADWQKANYATITSTVQQNITSCLADLDSKQADVLAKLRS